MGLAILLLPTVTALAAADESPLRPALDAARRREERLPTVSVSWKVTTFAPKGGRMDADPVGLPLPRMDITVESAHRLVLQGKLFRVEYTDPGWTRQVSGTFDGATAYDGERLYHRLYHQGRDHPSQLLVERARDSVDHGGFLARPLALWCRGGRLEPYHPQDPPGHPVARSLTRSDRAVEVSLSWTPRSGTRFLLDPARDYLVHRIRVESGETTEVTDVEFREQPGVGWVPDRWTTVKSRGGGTLVQRDTAAVTEVRVGEPAPPETFRLDPVPREMVSDMDRQTTYFVRADGTREEPDATPPEPAEPEARPIPEWPGRKLVRYGLFPVLLVAVLAPLILRRRPRPPHTPSP